MHIIEKPEGFELRDARSEKTNAADKWTPQDALYGANQRMGDKAESVTVIWRERNSNGGFSYHRSNSGPRGSTLELTVTALGIEMGWAR